MGILSESTIRLKHYAIKTKKLLVSYALQISLRSYKLKHS